MTNLEDNRRQQVALFRYGLIADVIHLPKGTQGIGERLQEKSALTYVIPHSPRYRVAVETMRHWLQAYRAGGFDALLPKLRKDAGQSHALPREVADLLCEIKDDNPALSVQLVIQQARESGKILDGLPLPPSTVHRLLSRAGLMRRNKEPVHKDHRRFAFENANDLWMSDVMHGPTVHVGGKVKRKTYLIAFIDDATRVVPFAAFALAENTAAFLPVFKQAIMRRGIPKRLFVDNGAAFRSQHVQLVCAKLGVTLIHARPYHPQAKGKQERWFRTVRLQLLPRLKEQDTQSLEALNRRLWAYVEGEYHQAPHRGLADMTPLDAWAERAAHVQYIGHRADIEDLFLFEQRRKVQSDRTVSLHGIAFEVEADLVGASITLRFDPDRPRGPIQVWKDNERFADAKPVDLHANCFVHRQRPPTDPESDLPASTLRLSEMRRSDAKEDC
jgi:putative transposase